MKGKFITFEGIDGCGKTTISREIKKQLEKEGYEVVYSREPGGIMIAEEIRKVILDPKNQAMEGRTEALLYAASRRQHLIEKILPALDAGKIVLCDRFIDSSLAYQGYARGIGINAVYQMNAFAIEGHMPDVTLFLRIDVQTGLARMSQRNGKDRLEMEGSSFQEKVYEGYEKVIALYPDRIQVVDALQDLQSVYEQCYKIIKEILHD